jgi:hypothetical protein
MYFDVTDASYKGQYKIDLRFEDGSSGTVDFEKFLAEGTILAKLKDITLSESLPSSTELWYGKRRSWISHPKRYTRKQQGSR